MTAFTTYRSLYRHSDGEFEAPLTCSDNIGGPGIYVEGDRNRIEGNHLTKNNWGIYLLDVSPTPEDRAEKNIVRLNTAAQNDGSGNYYIGTSNYVAAMDTDGSFTNAHANFSF